MSLLRRLSDLTDEEFHRRWALLSRAAVALADEGEGRWWDSDYQAVVLDALSRRYWRRLGLVTDAASAREVLLSVAGDWERLLERTDR